MGRIRCAFARDLALVKRGKQGAVESFVKRALDVLDLPGELISSAESMVTALRRQAQRAVDSAAAFGAGVDLVVDNFVLEAQRVMDILRAAVRRAAYESGKESHSAFKAWVEKAVAKGARVAHAWVRRRNGETAISAPLLLDGSALPSVDAVVATRSEQWRAKWSTAGDSAPLARLRLRELIGRVRSQDREFATRDALQLALKRLDKTRGLGSDATEVGLWQGARLWPSRSWRVYGPIPSSRLRGRCKPVGAA